MRSVDTFKAEDKHNWAHDFLVAACAFFVIGTTLLNIAFSLAPATMVHLVRTLIAA